MTVEQHPSTSRPLTSRDRHPSGPLPAVLPTAPAPTAPVSGFAVSSLVWSLIGLLTLGVAAVGGVVCGHIALEETRTGTRGGRGMAVAGLVIGWIQIVGWLLVGAVVFFDRFLPATSMSP